MDATFMLTALSPLDGRYAHSLNGMREHFSEFGLIRHRMMVELAWLRFFNQHILKATLSHDSEEYLNQLVVKFDQHEALRVKALEKTTNHDVKAVEYYLKERFQALPELAAISEFLHFGCTSEDINNLAYALQLKTAHQTEILPLWQRLINELQQMGQRLAEIPMLARTHGQPATPTTVGKEIINVVYRLQRQYHQLQHVEILGKFNGAVGNYNAQLSAYPEIDWPQISQRFVESLGLTFNPYTTQIEPHDYLAEYFQCISRFNTIIMDLDRDMWGYISLNYFTQKVRATEVGSSTMPHKVNPIDFENAEGNLGVANALLLHMSSKLPQSRWQRDLSDSTVLRNIGVALGHCLLAYHSTLKGLAKLEVNPTQLSSELNQHWEVLSEAIQTVMRRYAIAQPYEKLKQLSRGKQLTSQQLIEFIAALNLPADEKQRLSALTPHNYVGLAAALTQACHKSE